MRVRYRVARMRGEKLHVYPGVYGRAGDFASAVRAELARAGQDPSEVDAVSMRYLRDRAYSRGGASFALASSPKRPRGCHDRRRLRAPGRHHRLAAADTVAAAVP